MFKLLQTEVYKLVHSGALWGVGVLAMVLASVMLLDSRSETATDFLASLYNTPLLGFLTIVFVTLHVGSDLEGRTLRLAVTGGQGRVQVIVAKMLTVEWAAFLILALPLVVHGICGGSWGVTGATMVAIVSSIVAMNMLPFFWAVVFGDLGRAMAVSLLCYFVMIFLLNSDTPDNGFPLSRFLPMGQLRLIAMDELPVSAAFVVSTCAVWMLVPALCAVWLFARRDLK